MNNDDDLDKERNATLERERNDYPSLLEEKREQERISRLTAFGEGW